MKGKRHPNGYVERRGKTGQLGRSIHQRYQDFPHYQEEFGHLEADTVQGKAYQGAVVKGGFKLSFYGGLKMYDLGGLGIDRCQAI